MAHKITMERAKQLYNREQELCEMQKTGQPLPKSTRRQKKYLQQVKRQEGYIKYIIARIKMNGGKLPKHLKEEK